MAELFAVTPGRRALVTGGASGIGLGTARRLRELGAAVAVADLTQAIAGMSAQDRADLVAIPMDVTSESAVAEGVAHAVEALGTLDTLVNCAGVFQFRALEDISTTEWDTILSVNLRGTFLVMRQAMPHLKASGQGRIVNVASDAGKRGFPLLGAYCASKFAVVGLTQAVATEVAASGVRVNAVCPATIAETSMGRTVIAQKIELGYGVDAAEVVARGAASFPLQRVGTVADAVDAILFLISEGSSWITGESIDVDGGSLAG